MSCANEFATVDLILQSRLPTRAVDAFALSMIKAERQVRKLFTYLVFQSPSFGPGDQAGISRILVANKNVYFSGLVAGIDALAPVSVKQLVGGAHDRLWSRFEELKRHRDKIFHGQPTGHELSRTLLLEYVGDIRLWCSRLATGAERELGFDGFTRNSFRKVGSGELAERFRAQLTSLEEYKQFIQEHMETDRQRPKRKVTVSRK